MIELQLLELCERRLGSASATALTHYNVSLAGLLYRSVKPQKQRKSAEELFLSKRAPSVRWQTQNRYEYAALLKSYWFVPFPLKQPLGRTGTKELIYVSMIHN